VSCRRQNAVAAPGVSSRTSNSGKTGSSAASGISTDGLYGYRLPDVRSRLRPSTASSRTGKRFYEQHVTPAQPLSAYKYAGFRPPRYYTFNGRVNYKDKGPYEYAASTPPRSYKFHGRRATVGQGVCRGGGSVRSSKSTVERTSLAQVLFDCCIVGSLYPACDCFFLPDSWMLWTGWKYFRSTFQRPRG
jgi:hypothetical protein